MQEINEKIVEKSISNITVATFLSGCMQEIIVKRWEKLISNITVATFLSGRRGGKPASNSHQSGGKHFFPLLKIFIYDVIININLAFLKYIRSMVFLYQ